MLQTFETDPHSNCLVCHAESLHGCSLSHDCWRLAFLCDMTEIQLPETQESDRIDVKFWNFSWRWFSDSVLCVVTPYNLVGRYRSFREICYLDLHSWSTYVTVRKSTMKISIQIHQFCWLKPRLSTILSLCNVTVQTLSWWYDHSTNCPLVQVPLTFHHCVKLYWNPYSSHYYVIAITFKINLLIIIINIITITAYKIHYYSAYILLYSIIFNNLIKN
jgi:hypothetical protein